MLTRPTGARSADPELLEHPQPAKRPIGRPRTNKPPASKEKINTRAVIGNNRPPLDDDQLVAEVNALVDEVCRGAVAVSTVKSCQVLDIGRTSLHRLMNDGVLKFQKIGRATRIFVPSIKEVLRRGVANMPKQPLKRGN
jgi:hypothetical protein